MFDECPGCGELQLDATVEPADSTVVCPNCGYRQSIRRLPLFVVSGASGTGKSTVLRELRGTRDDVVLLDSDVLWRDDLWDDPEWFFRTWLCLCRDVAQSNRPPVLFGAGFGVPANLRAHPQYDCFSAVHYLVLVCDAGEQERRLEARPSDRHPEQFDIGDQIEFNRQLEAIAAEEGFPIVDTTDLSVSETVARVDRWITGHLEPDDAPCG